jgi:hypothetical protein
MIPVRGGATEVQLANLADDGEKLGAVTGANRKGTGWTGYDFPFEFPEFPVPTHLGR